jgi:serine/threonine protein kinase
MSDPQKRDRFGRYLILDHLVDGGMAKICRARFLGEQADKVVAIKMVQEQFSKDEAFKTMFMDEIKVTFGLLHPNIIQTYDYGLNKNQLYVAMEYCDGRNLKEYLEKLKERKFVFPVEISTYIISQACQGLYYAHTFRDKLTGQEANIIHRDISPHNIMLTYDGSVKIIDFGIAKSQTNSEATQAGTIKGKLSYLAPEYLEGLELDARYDQFALGITLWEMLCSRKLFKENNDLAILKKIQECKIPVPSSINPNVPKELDEIVLKALSKNRNKRFENLDQMNRALMKFLYAKYPDFNSTDLSYFAQELFKDEIKKDREKMFEFGKIDIKPFLEDMKRELEKGSHATERSLNSNDSTVIRKEMELDFGFENPEKKKHTITVKKAPKERGTDASEDSTLSRKISDITDLTGTDLKKIAPKNSKKEATKIIKIDHKKNNNDGGGSFGRSVALFAMVVGGGYYYHKNYIKPQETVKVAVEANKVNKQREPAQDITPTEDQSGVAKMMLSHFDKQKMQVFINGNKTDVDLLNIVTVPVGTPFILRVQIEGKKHFIKEFNLSNDSSFEIEIPEMSSVAYGYIFTSKGCSMTGEIRYEIYGEKRISPVPMSQAFGEAFPLVVDDNGSLAPSTYDLYFKKTGEEIERKITVTIKHEDQSVDLCEHL